MPDDFAELEQALGHQFQDAVLLRRALTHKSVLGEQAAAGQAPGTDNEQLEFLGDAVLGFLVSEALLGRFPDAGEGKLSKLRALLVNARHLGEVARTLDLGRFLILGRGEEITGGRAKQTLLADALEAVVAAIYLDGGIEAARAFVLEHVGARLKPTAPDIDPAALDFKSALQELARSLKLPMPRYLTVKEEGPQHAKTFTVEVRIGSDHAAQGQGPSRKIASQRAAEYLLGRLRTAVPA